MGSAWSASTMDIRYQGVLAVSRSALDSISVVIVTWNSSADVRRCLTAVEGSRSDVSVPLDVIVIDNGSVDETVPLVKEYFPDVLVITSHRNLGFGAAANIGIARTCGDAVLIINPDAYLEEGALVAMLQHLRSLPNLGCVAPLHLTDNDRVESPARRFPTLMAAIADGTIIQRVLPQLPALRSYYMSDDMNSDDPDWLVGACLCFRRSAVAETGGFDVGYEMYSEETDLLRELRSNGWRCAVTPNARIQHRGGASADQDPIARERHFFKSRYRYVTKTWGWPVATALRVFVAISGLIRLLEQVIRMFRPAHRNDARREIRQIAALTVWQWFGWGR